MSRGSIGRPRHKRTKSPFWITLLPSYRARGCSRGESYWGKKA